MCSNIIRIVRIELTVDPGKKKDCHSEMLKVLLCENRNHSRPEDRIFEKCVFARARIVSVKKQKLEDISKIH
jgi:hypothetical protein